jgi:hypothetical protein
LLLNSRGLCDTTDILLVVDDEHRCLLGLTTLLHLLSLLSTHALLSR